MSAIWVRADWRTLFAFEDLFQQFGACLVSETPIPFDVPVEKRARRLLRSRVRGPGGLERPTVIANVPAIGLLGHDPARRLVVEIVNERIAARTFARAPAAHAAPAIETTATPTTKTAVLPSMSLLQGRG
jgi:hypothetical protein